MLELSSEVIRSERGQVLAVYNFLNLGGGGSFAKVLHILRYPKKIKLDFDS
jgi:hypothetical protein